MFANRSPVLGGTTTTRFVAPTGQENGVANKYQCISLMKEYLAKSFEELRLEDYQLNRRDPQHASRNASLQPNFFSSEMTGPFCQFGQTTTPTFNGFGGNLGQINGGGGIFRSGTVAPASVGFHLSSANQPQSQQSMFSFNDVAAVPPSTLGGAATSMTNAPVLIASRNFTIQPRLDGPFNFSFSCNANSATPSSPPLTIFGEISFGFPANPSATGNGTTTGLEAGFTAAAPTFLSSNRSNHQFGNPCSSIFGQPAQPSSAATTNEIFPFSSFHATTVVGTPTHFVAKTGLDFLTKRNSWTLVNVHYQSISTMKEYEAKSYEELRFEDYQLNRKGSQRHVLWGNTNSMDFASGATSVLGGFAEPTTTTASMQANSPAELRKVGAKMTLYLQIKFKMEMEAYLFRGRSVIELPGFPGYRLRPIDMNSFRVLFIEELQSAKKEKTALCVIGGCTKDPIEDTWLCREHNKRMEPPGAGAQEPRPFFRRVQQVPPFNPPNNAINLRNDEYDLSFLFSNEA